MNAYFPGEKALRHKVRWLKILCVVIFIFTFIGTSLLSHSEIMRQHRIIKHYQKYLIFDKKVEELIINEEMKRTIERR